MASPLSSPAPTRHHAAQSAALQYERLGGAHPARRRGARAWRDQVMTRASAPGGLADPHPAREGQVARNRGKVKRPELSLTNDQ